jgi:hypothetical protein
MKFQILKLHFSENHTNFEDPWKSDQTILEINDLHKWRLMRNNIQELHKDGIKCDG